MIWGVCFKELNLQRITSANASKLNSITIDDGARGEIQQALSQDLEVTVHESPIAVNGWSGSGYAILDAGMGVGAYKISGGASGAFLVVEGLSLMGMAGLAILLASSFAALAMMAALFTLGTVSLIEGASHLGVAYAKDELKISDIEFVLKYIKNLAGILSLLPAAGTSIPAAIVYTIGIVSSVINSY